jgi:hypothetical protein
VVTDAAGFSVLVLAKIIMIQMIAVLCTFWAFCIFLLVAILCPLLCYYLPVPKREVKETGKARLSERMFSSIGSWAFTKARWPIIVSLVIIVVIAAFISTKLVVGDIYPGSPILWPDSEFNKAIAEINSRFDNAGTDTMNIVIQGEEGTMEDPEVLRTIEAYERYIKEKMGPVVGGTRSLVKVVKKLNMENHEGDPQYYRIPDNLQAIGIYYMMFWGAGDPQDFNTFSDFHYKNGNILVFFKNHLGETVRKAISLTREFIETHPLKKAEFKMAGGVIGIIAACNEEIERSQISTLASVLTIIFIFCILSFRSILAGIQLIIPLIMANLVAFAYMALAKIGLDVNTLPISAIGMGLGVDYGIYLLMRMREEHRKSQDLEKSVIVASATAGRAIFYTALMLIFSVSIWYFSNIKFIAQMGFLLGFLLFFNCLGAIFFHPAAVSLIKPKFITGK